MRALPLALLVAARAAFGAEPTATGHLPGDGSADRPVAIAPPRARGTAHGLVLELRSDLGFRRLVSIEYTNGHRNRMNLNDGLTIALGTSFLPLASGRFVTRATVGVKVDTLRAENGTALFTAVPVDLVEAAYLGAVRLGAGASVLLWPRLAADGFLEDEAFRSEPAPGVVLDAEWILSARTRTGLGVRASWYRFAWHGATRGAPSIGLVVRSDLELGGGR